jgi:predicted DNA-binding helix-hairpin-helix protein
MNELQALQSSGPYMDFEVDEDDNTPPARHASFNYQDVPCQGELKPINHVNLDDIEIARATLPGGRRMPLLKTVLTSVCERNCNYCGFRNGRDFRRSSFTPEKLADMFMQLWRGGVVQGLFLSSGVAGGGVRTQDRLIAAAELLREKHQYPGYMHLKIMPGAERAQVERAMQLADRVSINLEAPNTQRLAELAPGKVRLDELLEPLRWVEQIRHSMPPHLAWKGRHPSSTTQFVVGGVGESDLELLKSTDYLHRRLNLSRVYYSGFKPVLDTPLENQRAVDPWRRYRLFQASFLLRDYPFQLNDFILDGNENLPVDVDPKSAWAQAHLKEAPLEINRASPQDLMRIPGIGKVCSQRILAARRVTTLRTTDQLKKMGIHVEHVMPFILLNGRRPLCQMRLW